MCESVCFCVQGYKANVYVHIIEMVTTIELLHIYQYSVVIELSDKKNKLISLYRKLSGEWIDNIPERDNIIMTEIKKLIELQNIH
jgi:hypothetical protein